jgi:hypothetical protein
MWSRMEWHPILDLVAVFILSSTIIGFTSAQSIWRLASLLVLIQLAWHCVSRCTQFLPRSSWAAIVGGQAVSLCFHYLDVGLLNQWCFEIRGPQNGRVNISRDHTYAVPRQPQSLTQIDRHDSSVWSRLRFGMRVMSSWRFINTPFQVKGVSASTSNGDNVSMMSSRQNFLWTTALTIVSCYAILDIMDSMSDPMIVEKFYVVSKVPVMSRIHDVSSEELIMRCFATLSLCISLVCVQRGMYCILAFLSVAARISNPQDWPPFNGPLVRAYSLRSFWGYVLVSQS